MTSTSTRLGSSEPARKETGRVEDAGDLVGQLDPDLRGRQVDGHLGPVPGGAVAARATQHPESHRVDQTHLLGDGDEDGRADRAPLRMGPAEQSLEPRNPAADVGQRLVVHVQLVALDRAPEIVLERLALPQASVEFRLEEACAAPAGGLGDAQRRLRVREHRLGGRRARVEECYADAGAGDDRLSLDEEGRREG